MTFDLATFLEEAGVGRKVVHLQPKQVFFLQGSPADSIFYLRTGSAKLAVVSPDGKEATVALLSSGEFIGEESLASVGGLHLATASAIFVCTALQIAREEMIRVMHEEHSLSEMYMKFLLARSMRTQANLVDQLFNSSERRLARILLLLAEFGEPGEPEPFIPPITQETLAEMVGTTRSRVCFFMNRFRKLGLIEYNGRIRVHRSLMNVILHDHFTEQQSCANGGEKVDSVQEIVHDGVIEMEDPRCKNQFDGVEIELEDPRYKGQFNGLVVEMEDPRCKSPFNSAETEMEDPRCKSPLRMW
jgi:CRP-like cAMP-binding protein